MENSIYIGRHYRKSVRLSRKYGKHCDEEQIRKSKYLILRGVIFAEFIFVLLSLGGIYMQNDHNVQMRKSEKAYAAISEVNKEDIESMATAAYKKTNERIVEEVSEYLWTKDEVVYRKGPDDSYEEAGTLEKEKMIERTGLTHNKWSRITIDEEEYYILSDNLTDETPVSALIAPGQKGEYQKYALSLFPDYGWSDRELEPLINLWNRESHWNPNAHNKSSGAHGIPQSLPASKMASEGSDYYTNGNTQIRWGLKYIAGRYGSPSNAWAFFLSHNSY